MDPYRILQIPSGTSDMNVIKRAYKKRCLDLHPDRLNVNSNAYDFAKLHESYLYLKVLCSELNMYKTNESVHDKLKTEQKFRKEEINVVPPKMKIDFKNRLNDLSVIAPIKSSPNFLSTYSEMEGDFGASIVNDGKYMFIDETQNANKNSFKSYLMVKDLEPTLNGSRSSVVCNSDLNNYRQQREHLPVIQRASYTQQQQRMDDNYHHDLLQEKIEHSRQIQMIMNNNLSKTTVSRLMQSKHIGFT